MPDTGAMRERCCAMQWLRSHARWGSALALFALVCQLTLCFSHVHIHDDPAHSQQLASASSGQEASTSSGDADGPVGEPNDHCPLCIASGLISTSLISEPPALPKLLLARSLQIAWSFENCATAQRCADSRARAPPLA